MADTALLGSVAVLVVILLLMVLVLVRSAYRIQPYEQGIRIVLGSFRGVLNPGLHFVPPLARVVRVDLRDQVLKAQASSILTRDGTLVSLAAVAQFRVVEAPKAVFQVQDYRRDTGTLFETLLRSTIADSTTAELQGQRLLLGARLRDALQGKATAWGLRIGDVLLEPPSIVFSPPLPPGPHA